jgi:predicted ABC-class ATPase
MKNVVELRNEMIKTYKELRSGKIGIREAKEYANVCGKVLASAKLQMEYNQFTKAETRIDFLEVEPK